MIIDARRAIQGLQELTAQISGRQLRLAISLAINRSLMQGRTVARRQVSNIYNISQRNLSAIDVKKSTASTLTAYIYADSKPIPLSAFSPVFQTPTRTITTTRRGRQKVKERKRRGNTTKGVTLEIFRGKRESISYAFMTQNITAVFGRGKYTNKGFLQRHNRQNSSGNDLTIQALRSISVHTAVINNTTINAIKNKVIESFTRELRHDLNRRVNNLSRP